MSVCPGCREAGRLLAGGHSSTAAIDALHRNCPGGTNCDCQHKTDRSVIATRSDG